MYGVVFPGQGSQHVGMSESLIKDKSIVKQTFEEASDTLGEDLIKLCLQGPEDQLRLTHNTQPALLTASVATYRALNQMGSQEPKAAAGHSVGEYAALVSAGVIEFSKAVELTRLRGELMQKSVPVGEGGMLAVLGLSSKEVDQLCHWAVSESGLSPLEPANFNAPGQVVISGNAKLIEWVSKNFTPEKIQSDKKKVRLIPLKVSAPFHCSMMQKAQEEMGAALSEVDFKRPLFPVVQNVSANMNTEPETIKKELISQISAPVKWVACMETFKDNKINFIGEFGPGQVLTGLAKKIDKEYFTCRSLNNTEDLDFFLDALNSVTRHPREASL